ncbi:MAG: antibiotic biosynthesis monooxygenase [Planctomycetaceae bacterium]|nr:antibiotic biosynthesis monooxygenase [Planctomycetaceae bacterium]
MFIYLVEIKVKPEYLEEFKTATLDNAQNTVREPGNFRFDVLQHPDDLTKFILYEVYADESGLEAHRKTDHYARWKTTVESWMAEPRKAVKFFALHYTQ